MSSTKGVSAPAAHPNGQPATAGFASVDRLRLARIKQYKQWHDKAYEHAIAHAKASTRDEILALTLPAVTAVLGVFSGTVWTVDLAGSGVPSNVVKLGSAIAGFAVAALVAISRAVDFAGRAASHAHASERFCKPKERLEKYLAEGKFETGLSDEEIDAVEAGYDRALNPAKTLNVSAWLLWRGRRKVRRERWAEDLLLDLLL